MEHVRTSPPHAQHNTVLGQTEVCLVIVAAVAASDSAVSATTLRDDVILCRLLWVILPACAVSVKDMYAAVRTFSLASRCSWVAAHLASQSALNLAQAGQLSSCCSLRCVDT